MDYGMLAEVRTRLRNRRVAIQNELRKIGEAMAADDFQIVVDGDLQSAKFANGYMVGLAGVESSPQVVADAVDGDDEIGGTDGDDDDDGDDIDDTVALPEASDSGL